jgi:hypothetical protein
MTYSLGLNWDGGAGGGTRTGTSGRVAFSRAFSSSSLSRSCGFLIELMSKPISRSNNGKEPKTMNITDWKTLPADVIKVFRKYRLISEQAIGPRRLRTTPA